MDIDKVLLGHNQFIGVDHMSQSRADKRIQHFTEIGNVEKIISRSMDFGVRGMMLSTHDKSLDITDMIRRNSLIKDEMHFYPLVPYLRKYMKTANEFGVVRMLHEKIIEMGRSSNFSQMSRAGIAYLSNDFDTILKVLLDMELEMFRGLKIRAIFLHNGLTDLAVSMKLFNVLELFSNHIKEEYGAIPGFCTVNYPNLVDFLSTNGYESPLIMAPFNPVGYQMNPSREHCESALLKYETHIIAMSTLASGYVKPDEAYKYIYSLPNIRSTVVGVSSEVHARETFESIKKHSNNG